MKTDELKVTNLNRGCGQLIEYQKHDLDFGVKTEINSKSILKVEIEIKLEFIIEVKMKSCILKQKS